MYAVYTALCSMKVAYYRIRLIKAAACPSRKRSLKCTFYCCWNAQHFILASIKCQVAGEKNKTKNILKIRYQKCMNLVFIISYMWPNFHCDIFNMFTEFYWWTLMRVHEDRNSLCPQNVFIRCRCSERAGSYDDFIYYDDFMV